MKHFTIYLALLLMSALCLQADYEYPEGPNDRDGDGYLNVSTLEHLCWINKYIMALSFDYELDNDINAADTKNWNDGKGFLPIGKGNIDYHATFSGNFDGHHHVIDSLYISADSTSVHAFGFLGIIENEKERGPFVIKNLGITNCTMINHKKGHYCGGFAGFIYDSVTIDSCFFTGTITTKTTNASVGGFVGVARNKSNISNCYSDVKIITPGGDKGFTGGFVGYSDRETVIDNCYAIADITVEAPKSTVGGFIGYSFYAHDDDNRNLFNNCYARTNITVNGDSSIVGGLIGKVEIYGTTVEEHGSQQFTNSYAVCNVNATANSTVGALVGDDGGGAIEMVNSFWDTDVSGITESVVGVGKTTAEMKTKITFLQAAWDFENIWSINPDINDGYPFLGKAPVAVTENILPNTNLTCSPNPCNTSSKIAYSVNSAGFVNIAVYDMLCNEVAVLVNNFQAAGEHEVVFNAEELSAGVYFVSINTNSTMETGKIIVAR